MNSPQTASLRRLVTRETFTRLCFIWQQMASLVGEEAIFLNKETLSLKTDDLKNNWGREDFQLLISPQLNALLLGKATAQTLFYQISITFDFQIITDFLTELNKKTPNNSTLKTSLQRVTSTSNNFTLSNLLMLQLIQILAAEKIDIRNSEAIYPQVSVCQPIENALRQQIEQERLLNQVVVQIRQSLELPVILETAVKEVKNFLQVDRLVIYQFESNLLSKQGRKNSFQGWGRITYEARESEFVPSIFNLIAEDDCFTYIPNYQKKYQEGLIVNIDDVETAYPSSFCLTEFLKKYSIKAKLIAPIIVQGKLWGLIIAHQCYQKRRWLASEKAFLGYIGEHLAIAIYQAQLYAEVQQQKNTFEHRVIERTQELRDTLVAAQAASQSKSEFLSNMSHELRTPLTSVIGLSGTLLHWSGEKSFLSVEKQKHYLKIIQDSGKQLLELVNNILELSQIEAGKSLLKISELSLSQLAQSVLQNLHEAANRQQVSLELELKVKSQDDFFWADREKVKQILFHLLDNAIKFTTAGGKVILRVWQEVNQVIFQIEDTGIGIAEHHLPLLFKKFQQLEKSRQRTHRGTGLGLALTKQLVELHQGTVEVDSLVGKGHYLRFVCPTHFIASLKKLSTSWEENQPASQGENIVLVATDEELATLLCELLLAAKYQVFWLIDSTTAIKKIKLLQPILVILDKNLPDVYDLSQTLKNLPETKTIKILVLSQRVTTTDWQNLAHNGIDDYLLKPILPTLLLQKVNALIFGHHLEEADDQ